MAQTTVIRKRPPNYGSERIHQRELQHTYWCDKILGGLCTRQHPGKRKLAENPLNDDNESVNEQAGAGNMLNLNLDYKNMNNSHKGSTNRIGNESSPVGNTQRSGLMTGKNSNKKSGAIDYT